MSGSPHRAPGAPSSPPPGPPRRRSTLLWLLALLLLILAVWYVIGRGDAPRPAPIGQTTPQPSQSPVSQEPGARERALSTERPADAGPAPGGRGDRAARPIAPQPPEYPRAALRGGVQGTVLVRVDVAADGRPTRVDIARSSGSRELDRAAQRAVEGWRFEPALKRGRPVPSVLEVPVEFRADTR